ncbi:MAG: response regulator [Clostridia bacterium]|nr:response regulator [Clostridia bacterium]
MMMKVLIIDDEEMIREGLRKAIDWDSLGCEIVGEAEDGDEGIELVESLKPEIVITDIRMPGLSGLEMIAKIKELKHDCKTVIITGFRDFDYAQEAIRLGAFRLLVKPTKSEDIINVIQEAVSDIKRKRESEKELYTMKKRVKEFYGLKDASEEDGIVASGENRSSSTFLVSKALNYMRENYSKNLDLKTVADTLYVSTWHLSKILKKETGNNFIDILNEIRIEEAKKLLSDPKYKVYEIAETVGFTDVPYFTKLFKKVTGLTPVEYKTRK